MEEKEYNFVDRYGNIVYDSWFKRKPFDEYWLFYNNEYKFLTTKEGKPIYTEGDGLFVDVRYIESGVHDSLLEVRREDGLLNIVVGDNLISKDWFRKIDDFYCYGGFGYGSIRYRDFAKVQREDGLWNYLTKEGKILYPQEWFDGCYDFDGEYVKVYNEYGLENILTKEGKMLFDEWQRHIDHIDIS